MFYCPPKYQHAQSALWMDASATTVPALKAGPQTNRSHLGMLELLEKNAAKRRAFVDRTDSLRSASVRVSFMVGVLKNS